MTSLPERMTVHIPYLAHNRLYNSLVAHSFYYSIGNNEQFGGYKHNGIEFWTPKDSEVYRGGLNNQLDTAQIHTFSVTTGTQLDQSSTLMNSLELSFELGAEFGSFFSAKVQTSVGFSWSTSVSATWFVFAIE